MLSSHLSAKRERKLKDVFKMLCGPIVFFAIMFVPAAIWAAHPLITDDSGTQGKGKYQLKLNAQHDFDKETIAGVRVESSTKELAIVLSYGATDGLDLVVGIPYLWNKVKEDGATMFSDKGIGDVTLEAQWRFYDENGLSFAIKPGISFPTGDDEKGFGTGKTGYSVFFIASKEIKPLAFHVNLGFMRNENKVEEEKNLWHVSVAGIYAVTENLKAAANIGTERNVDTAAHEEPAFLLGGVIYSVKENFDIDLGVKHGLNNAETELSYLAGAAFRFNLK
jgi:hypothetical protein